MAADLTYKQNTNTREKCQIDLLIQTKYNQLYVCEIKFSKTELQIDVVKEVQEKIERLEMS